MVLSEYENEAYPFFLNCLLISGISRPDPDDLPHG